mgnify:FL=1
MKYITIFILLVFSISAYSETTMENFKSSPEKRWQFFTDQVMGGRSIGKLDFLSEENISFARMTGDVTTENNGGFIQFRAQLGYKLMDSFEGIRLQVRGNNQDYFIHIRTKGSVLPWQYYGKKFFASSKWSEVELKFSEFQKSSSFMRKNFKPSSIRTIAIVAYGRDHKAEIEVSELKVF